MRTSCHSALVQGTQGPRAGLPECGGGCQGEDKGSGLSQLIDGPAGPSFLYLLARAPCPWDRELPRGSFAFPSPITHKCELQGFLQHLLNPGGLVPCTGVEELKKEMASPGDSKEMVKAVKELVAGWGRSARRLGGWGSNPAKGQPVALPGDVLAGEHCCCVGSLTQALLASNKMLSERLLGSRCSAWCPVARLGAGW